MQSTAFAVPLLPGQTEVHRIALASCSAGARKEAHQDARRRAGIVREAVWIQPGPGGDVAVVYLEADDLATAFALLGASAEPFDRWFRGHVRQVHGVAWDQGFARGRAGARLRHQQNLTRTRKGEQDPRRQESLQAARAMMADVFDRPPQFTDLRVADEWTG